MESSHKKKNWLFFGDADAGERGAILYTIIESCRSRGIDPYAYLRDVLTRLPFMTNWQVKHVSPEARTRSRSLAAATAALPIITVIARGHDIHAPHIKVCQEGGRVTLTIGQNLGQLSPHVYIGAVNCPNE
jgi:IS66 C-terminal element